MPEQHLSRSEAFVKLSESLRLSRVQERMETQDLKRQLDEIQGKFNDERRSIVDEFFYDLPDDDILAILDPFEPAFSGSNKIQKIKAVRDTIYAELQVHVSLRWTKEFVERNL